MNTQVIDDIVEEDLEDAAMDKAEDTVNSEDVVNPEDDNT